MTLKYSKTNRHFATRIREHLASDKHSHIFKHLKGSENCHSLCSEDCFKILDSAYTRFQLKIKEAMHIVWKQLSLNSQVKHLNLSLSYWVVSFLSLNSLSFLCLFCVCIFNLFQFSSLIIHVISHIVTLLISLLHFSYLTLYNWQWMMFHPKHVLIQCELQKYRLVYQSNRIVK